MQINSQNNLSFTSLQNPIKPFKIRTSKGTLFCSEIDYTKKQDDDFYKGFVKYFLDIFAHTSSHPFWEKCREPNLNKWTYKRYVKSTSKELKNFLQDKDTTLLTVKDKNDNLVGAIYTRKLDLSKKIRDDDTLYVDSIAISPEYRGFSIGKKILKKVLNNSKKRFKEVFLVAYKESEKFYEKLGFTNLENTTAGTYIYKQLKKVRIDYPQYVSFWEKQTGKIIPQPRWFDRIENKK